MSIIFYASGIVSIRESPINTNNCEEGVGDGNSEDTIGRRLKEDLEGTKEVRRPKKRKIYKNVSSREFNY